MCRLGVYVLIVNYTNKIGMLNTAHFDNLFRAISDAFGQRVVSTVVILVAFGCGLVDIGSCT
jgi:hypothetical protein